MPGAVHTWPLERLIPHARNARTHSDEQVAQIAGSIAEFGFVNPVLVGDDGVIVAGHGRVMAARKLGLSEAPVKRSFKNGVLGETWIETGEAPDWQRLYERRGTWPSGSIPIGGLFLTAGADVQKDRIEVDVWAWGRGLQSWLVDHIVIEGGPEHASAWTALDQLLSRSWRHVCGADMQLSRLAIDTGYEAPAVYARAAAWIVGADRWTDATWRNLERQAGIAAEVAEDLPVRPASTSSDNLAGMIRRGPPRQSRRVFGRVI
jgi:phage terminase large subunit GpA-like protein